MSNWLTDNRTYFLTYAHLAVWPGIIYTSLYLPQTILNLKVKGCV